MDSIQKYHARVTQRLQHLKPRISAVSVYKTLFAILQISNRTRSYPLNLPSTHKQSPQHKENTLPAGSSPSKPAPPQPAPLLEVEQKFSFSIAKIALLACRGGFPRFKSLGDFHTQAFRDTYYDSANKLSNAGLYFRSRDVRPDPSHPTTNTSAPGAGAEWEVKQSVQRDRSPPSFLRTSFAETKDRRRIRELVRAHFPDAGAAGLDGAFGLDAIARFETHRLAFVADGRFTVVLDVTDFGHGVGEVELMAEDAERAHGDIDAFLREYAWFFVGAEPKGKLTAYFEKFGYPMGEV